MYSPFLWAFVICLVWNYIKNGGSFILFSRFVNITNSIREKSPRFARLTSTTMKVEYKYGKRIYCIVIPRKEPMQWIYAGVLKDGAWLNKTGKIEHFAGPFKNFYGLALTPRHISEKYEKLAFQFSNDLTIHIEPDEIIARKLKDGQVEFNRRKVAQMEADQKERLESEKKAQVSQQETPN